ncbi:LysR family transcriptional regulator [Ensifer sp.]|uniref:LysR family transcriptional regulator n=1 Tax=Ensifer sp. TaxID=1872086 RepID=UPI002896D776|nr:LysR family transcriptional regulator [Ensifer sp.]
MSDAFAPALLRTFVSVCSHGSLTRAAAQSGRAQSAISTQIRKLEDLVGHRLLSRTGRGVVPTTEGEVFLGFAKRILALGEAAASRLDKSKSTATVRMGLGEDIAPSLLPSALARLRRTHPHIHLDICIDEADALAQRWGEGYYDLAIASTSAFASEPLNTWQMDLHWVAGIDYEIDETQPLDIIVYGGQSERRRLMFESLSKAGREFRVAVTSFNLQAIAASVESGLGVSLLTSSNLVEDRTRIVTISPGEAPALSHRYGLFVTSRTNASVNSAIQLLSQTLNILTIPPLSPTAQPPLSEAK